MMTLRTVGDLRAALEPARRTGRTIGLVPTMGALHEGHLSLIQAARTQCDVVVVSLFVNPSQFDEHADLDRYPRNEDRDRDLAGHAGADFLFAPTPEEIYPRGFSTTVEVAGLTDRLEGAVRGATHFRGVTTIVTKLFNITRPDIAYFGQKDAQQAIVIRRLVDDLELDLRVAVCPTVREPDGLAMSSRNAHLSPSERHQALALNAALTAAEEAASDGECSADELLQAGKEAMASFGVEPEYLALVSPETLEPVSHLEEPALLALAARIGTTRLIDNVTLKPAPIPGKRSLGGQVRAQSPHSATSSPDTPTPREAQATCSA